MHHLSPSLRTLKIEYLPPGQLTPSTRNARRHPRRQIQRLADAIRQFGFTTPIVVTVSNEIVAGHARLEAAKRVGLERVPVVRLDHLSEQQVRALALFDNKIAELAEWDPDLLAQELAALTALDVEFSEFSLELTGFETAEIDIILQTSERQSSGKQAPADEQGPALNPDLPPVTRAGDLWLLGPHRLLCGDAREAAAFEHLLGGDKAEVVFADPPYNVPIAGHVSGLGSIRHREFPMASGEMSQGEFTHFLTTVCSNMADFSQDGAIHFICMDWRHMHELLTAGRARYELKNLCVWVKNNGGMGSLYRSQHELVFVFKSGDAAHINNVQLGRFGRNRTNVWQHAGVNTFRSGRDEELQLHPTPKPVDLVTDAIRDCSHRNAIVLDPFAGSGTTIIAAERSARRAAALEIDPLYCDTAVKRWQSLTGQTARLANSDLSFEEATKVRLPGPGCSMTSPHSIDTELKS